MTKNVSNDPLSYFAVVLLARKGLTYSPGFFMDTCCKRFVDKYVIIVFGTCPCVTDVEVKISKAGIVRKNLSSTLNKIRRNNVTLTTKH